MPSTVTNVEVHRVLEMPSSGENDDIFLAKSSSGVDIGITALSGEVLTPQRAPTLVGPTSLYQGQKGIYTLTASLDGDDYAVTSDHGDVFRTGNVIEFTPFLNRTGDAELQINHRTVTIEVLEVKPAAPLIEAPVDGAVGIDPREILLAASSFELNADVFNDTHVATDWELSTDAEFTNIVASSYGDTVNLTTWSIES